MTVRLALIGVPEGHNWWRVSDEDREAGEQEQLSENPSLLSEPPTPRPCPPALLPKAAGILTLSTV